MNVRIACPQNDIGLSLACSDARKRMSRPYFDIATEYLRLPEK
ncbi:hypothetical protein EIKCOROL_01062 [Eikenella corrodens ATCC 23834]|uniref:Uncharacterized protein n=1 Tax=Eikenella corrodens ATCC 23834 TaxID=546274 RepID=C0DUM6_EIKCO|nr:hypothetical protein EIKCOROL_01062 [Eikenella corrodens ATCC 23834]